MDDLAPIVLFVYNRLDHTKQTLEALLANELANQSEIFIYSDAAKSRNDEIKVAEVREYIKKVSGFKKVTIIQRERNFGLASNIIDGVTKIVNEYGKIIVLEDDLITSPYFLSFMNKGLELYKGEPRVASIHGYVYPIDGLPETFFIKGADCWGWATWSDKWSIFEPNGQKLLDEIRKLKLEKEIDFNGSYGFVKMLKSQIVGKNNSWAIRWYASTFLNGMLTLYPGKSYVQNIGFDSQATHC
ncbi:glycosyltransferase, partial [Campylobacter concisus]